MDNFNYGLEFYYNEIFLLDNPKLFKQKVKEAKQVDKYFESYGINMEYIRPYILYAYRLNKNLGVKNIIRYVKGLVYANDYVNFSDVENISSDLKLIENLTEDESDNESLWAFNGLLASANVEKFANNISDDELLDGIDTSNNVTSIDSKEFNKIVDLINNEELDTDDEDIIEDDIPIEYISVEDKIDLFKRKSNIYIKNTIEYKLKDKMIDESDVKMVRKAMRDWFKIIFSAMEDLVKINDKTNVYKDKNIIKYL